MAPPFIYCGSSESEDNGPGEKALTKAALQGNLRRVKALVRLLKGKGDPKTVFSMRTEDGFNVLHIAACTGQLEVCKYLVELGGDVNAPGRGPVALGATPFMAACQCDHVPTVEYFLESGGDVMKADDKGRTALHHAASTGSCEVTELLLSKGVPVDTDYGQGTPLAMAVANGKHRTLKVLLEHHANPNIIIGRAGSPLLSALINRSWTCVNLLIKAGADVNCKGCTINPLVYATTHGGYTNYIKLLLKAGADPNIPDDLGRLPIEIAALHGLKEEVEMLFPITSPIQHVPDWTVEGVLSLSKVKDKQAIEQQRLERTNYLFKSQADTAFIQESKIVSLISGLVRWRLEEAGKTKQMFCMTSERKDRGQIYSSQRESDGRVEMQLYVAFDKLRVPVNVPIQCTVRQAVSRASREMGFAICDYFIIYSSRILDLENTLVSQNVQPGSTLTPTLRLRGGVPERMTWNHPFIDFTHSFGDDLFDLCSIPNHHQIAVSLDQPGTEICFYLVWMIYRLFKKGQCAPTFTAADIVFNNSTGSFSFRPDFDMFENVNDDRFDSSMKCLAMVIRRTFYYSPTRVQQGQPVIRVLVHGEDNVQVNGSIPDYVAYFVEDLMDIHNIVKGALLEELLEYFLFNIVMKTSDGRIAYHLDSALYMKCYPGGIQAFSQCMEPLRCSWTKGMIGRLTMVRSFYKLKGDMLTSLPCFALHTRNFISHEDVHKMSSKQAEALVMQQSSEFVHQLSIDLSLRIPVKVRTGEPDVPVILPPSTTNRYVVDDFSTKQIGQTSHIGPYP